MSDTKCMIILVVIWATGIVTECLKKYYEYQETTQYIPYMRQTHKIRTITV
jgi:hypothetical protein